MLSIALKIDKRINKINRRNICICLNETVVPESIYICNCCHLGPKKIRYCC